MDTHATAKIVEGAIVIGCALFVIGLQIKGVRFGRSKLAKLHVLVGPALVLWGFYLIGGASSEPPKPLFWQSYRSANAAFSAIFPGTPLEEDNTASIEGNVVHSRRVYLNLAAFQLSVNQTNSPLNPSVPSESALREIAGKMATQYCTSVADFQLLTLKGFPAACFTITPPNETPVYWRIFADKDHVVFAFGTGDGSQESKHQIHIFLDNFGPR